MELGKEYFGPLWSFVASNEITDIDYNGKEIWLTNIFNERFRANQQFVTQYMTPAFVEQFTQRIANVVSRQFNKRNPELEAETSELRVTILHESVAKSGRSISIRKTPPLIRLTAESAIAEKFCSEELLAVLINCVKTKMNITFCGMPGIGKTECVKFFSQFIPANERVITIEDTLEIRYVETNPGKDCIEMKVSEDVFGYSEAIKSYDLLDVTAHEDNLDKLEVYALYDSGRNDCTGSISADGSSISFPDYGVYDMHVRITCKNGTRDHVRISIPINRKVADI